MIVVTQEQAWERLTIDGEIPAVKVHPPIWREAGPERGRSGPDAERYARRHWWHVVTTDGVELKFYCERQARTSRRWWVYSVKEPPS